MLLDKIGCKLEQTVDVPWFPSYAAVLLRVYVFVFAWLIWASSVPIEFN